eukprot:14530388-Alexandrium_andersonii.AAC.1
MPEIPDPGAHDELTAALRYCGDTMAQVAQDAVDAGIDEEVDARASALLDTLGRWQATMGVC